MMSVDSWGKQLNVVNMDDLQDIATAQWALPDCNRPVNPVPHIGSQNRKKRGTETAKFNTDRD